ncbi:MAG: hypothetical protein SFV54_28260 [Bryobacteraceae bacterium]|nr:hypothetical protein [Bryobacteraceae bacterium]
MYLHRILITSLVALVLSVFAPSAFAETRAQRSPVTLLVEFDQPYSEISYLEMQRELENVLRPAGVRLNFKLKSEMAQGESFDDLVLVRFRGNCKLDHYPIVFDERGPLAYSLTVEGEVQPYSVVRCDHVRKSVRSAMFGGDHARADRLMGRALGRVVAHELYHIVGRTHDHGKEGIARKGLSGKALISDRLEFDTEDAARIK